MKPEHARLDGIRAVLFDLDGTLVDTAPDLGNALNLQRARHGLAPLAADVIRPQASHGARGLLALGFDLKPDDPRFAAMREEFLQLYADNICQASRPFPGVPELLDALEARGYKWGVVTNKPARFTEPLMSVLDLAERAACIVSGDSCPQPKPHPAPMLVAARRCDALPAQCLYLGDAERDVQAATAAGMPALVAAWGYLGAEDAPHAWGAHAQIHHPLDTLDYLPA
ncbi:putative 2-phosphoglycolate phosphatase [Thiobacillus denitrificans ATCC 25259]|uniref:phosphoglycolate phosphatase n=1 Tax=Thiobacillus denitrificans (strain ATCC 25259 / T1) TaxID=292415 RepID=Q3SK92_THIDA|nr:phosphoglycolate phosphatase [Thiobacillus denitrificans]AAZ96898.1 putative 2-phosphoglycolate phosphatase [Thiobacillus denitrificans ATCC 25259]